jgi:SulP family sulfate permease
VDLLHGFGKEPLKALKHCLEERVCPKGSVIFKMGDKGDELFIVRRGRVRIVLPLSSGRGHHIASFSRGDTFGEVAFLDGGERSADAEADQETALYVISRRRFEEASKEVPQAAHELFASLARTLALRLRTTNNELTALQDE